MKKLLAIVALVMGLGIVAAVAMHDKEKCDLKNVQKGHYCEACKKACSTDQVDKDGTCKGCGKKVAERELCVKGSYTCSECKHVSDKPGTCHGKDMVKEESKALVIFKCPMCGMTSDKAGECSMCHKAFEKTCDKSGTVPHVGVKVEEKKDDHDHKHDHK